MSVFGAGLAAAFALGPAAVHAFAVCLAVYVAHLKDGYVDYYVRGEDETNPLEPAEIRTAMGVSAAVFGLCLLALWFVSGPIAVALTAPLLAFGYFHAPQLDTHPVTGTADYPIGIALATAGGYAAQTGTVGATIVAVCLVFGFLLAAINVMLDRTDYDHDRRVPKRTLPVALGPARALRVAWTLVSISLGLLVFSSAIGVLPSSAVLAGVVPAAVSIGSLVRPPDPERLVGLFIGATYLFGAILFLSIRIVG
ncbi:UbiA family prenyltransferase [Natronolimnohabitans innermongolicus]|nr:UbiA family prenyltransferase [Natronolimnohabitans innermongolicus]